MPSLPGDGLRPMHDRWAFLGVNLRIASWNCPGLCGSLTADGNKLSLKTKRLSELCEKHDVVCLQEAHCSEADCYNMNSRDQSFFMVFSSWCSVHAGWLFDGHQEAIV